MIANGLTLCDQCHLTLAVPKGIGGVKLFCNNDCKLQYTSHKQWLLRNTVTNAWVASEHVEPSPVNNGACSACARPIPVTEAVLNFCNNNCQERWQKTMGSLVGLPRLNVAVDWPSVEAIATRLR